jgi:Spy/CpxP family protein refolding chaperone
MSCRADPNGIRITEGEVVMKSGFLALVLLCGAGGAFAQTPPDHSPGRPNTAHELERLTTLLDLTDTQQAQVKTILDAEHAKMRAQFQAAQASGTKPSFEEMRAARQQARADTVQQLTPVLTASQLKKFQVLMEEERGPRGHGPHGPSSGDAPPVSPN